MGGAGMILRLRHTRFATEPLGSIVRSAMQRTPWLWDASSRVSSMSVSVVHITQVDQH